MAVAIKLENLTKIYRKTHLGKVYKTLGVQDLSLEIEEGEIFGLLGLNGSGKTTTIKLILGLLFPTEGKISVFGFPFPDRKKLSLIGYLPEIPYFHKFLTGRETLKFYIRLSSVSDTEYSEKYLSESKIDEVLSIVNLKDADKTIGEFSKGMLQRLAIAQCLLHNPPLLIFDELVSGLDPLGIREMRDFVLQLKSKGKTVFFSSHLISEVEKVCDRVSILHNGKLVKIVNNDEWREKPLEEIFIESVMPHQ
ncbi:MAG: ABC transporter ATP-binding protein [Elusimicrobiota bacterium]|nr:ABC transporter ATP-binding protein [Elusimicrobiota bacterium]